MLDRDGDSSRPAPARTLSNASAWLVGHNSPFSITVIPISIEKKGYCPTTDATFPLLVGREILWRFVLVHRGVVLKRRQLHVIMRGVILSLSLLQMVVLHQKREAFFPSRSWSSQNQAEVTLSQRKVVRALTRQTQSCGTTRPQNSRNASGNTTSARFPCTRQSLRSPWETTKAANARRTRTISMANSRRH